MKISEVINILGCKVISGFDFIEDAFIETAFSSDLMSDVLTLDESNVLLLTGLCNLQSIRTAEMAEIKCILFVRDKRPTQEMISLATENDMILLEYPGSMFKASGLLYNAGVQPVY